MPPARKAVCVGINYAGTHAELRGAVHDALRWSQVLNKHCGFPKAGIATLIDEYPNGEPVQDDDANYSRPTKEGILEALEWLVEDITDGDAVMFTFSGHGTQVPDVLARKDARLDEAICPVDWEEFDWGVVPYRLITDDILHRFFARLPGGVLLTVVLDACFLAPPVRCPLLIDFEYPNRELDNERVSQGDYRRLRFDCEVWLSNQHVSALPRRLPFEPQRPLWNFLVKLLTRETAPPLDEGLSVFCITACRGSQSALDASLEGVSQGCLTYCLLRAFAELGYKCTYLELCEATSHIAMDLRIEIMPHMDQFFQLSYGKNAGPDECSVLDPASGYVAKEKSRRRRGQRFRLA
eukprot:TRINITY_DN45052_c0_g1_i1.p1 TRINITY_DN45052_c0_g1~~TRINITY_DN45052_c0_g1_i1.p1  ORF type:complete len:373 (-),score=49.09 TRINITY_DN45052_c0_g1_i1:47-1102(-)